MWGKRSIIKVLFGLCCIFGLMGSLAFAAEPQTETEVVPLLQNVTKAEKATGNWKKKKSGYCFKKKDGSYAKETWLNIDKKIYCFDAQGYRITGFYKYNRNKYFLDKNGVLATGMMTYKKATYYFKKDGTMAVSRWIKKKGQYYYFNTKGKMLKNRWLNLEGKKYFLDETGARVTGDLYVKNKACHFDKNGVYDPDKKVTGRIINPKKKMVALTFDDGPGPYTDRLLDALNKNKSVATFFVVGSSLSSYKNTVKKATIIGCEIGSHTWNHPLLTSLSASGIQSQVNETNKELRSIIGHNATVMRPPYGGYNSTVAANVGAPMILWSIDTLDWKTLNTQSTVNTVMNEVKDGSIVLMHDIHNPSVSAAEILIPKLISQGYQLVTVSELAKYRGKTLQNGSVYSSFYK